MVAGNSQIPVVVNSIAGRLDLGSPVKLLQVLTAERHLPVSVHAPSTIEEMVAMIRTLRRQRIPRIICAGGDGTVELVASQLVQSSVELGIIPTGTVNNLARSLGLPLDLGDAFALAVEGRSRTIAAGRVGDELFFEALGVGIFAESIARRTIRRSIVDIIRSFLIARREYQPQFVSVQVDGVSVEGPVLQCSVMNTATLAGMTLAPGTALDTPAFQVVMVRPQSLWRLFWEYRSLLRGQRLASSSLTLLSGTEVSITADPPLTVHADDRVIGTTPVVARIVPHALSVVTLPR